MQVQNALSLSQQETVVPLATVSGRGCQCTVYIIMYLYLFATHKTITYKILQFKGTKKCTGRNDEEV